MPSRAEVRGRFEIVLRALSMVIIAYLLWQSLDRSRNESVATGSTTSLSSSLHDWSRRGIAPDQISLKLDSVPSPSERDWLTALHASGSKVSWNGSLPAIALEVQPIASPDGGYNVLVSAPAGSSVVVGDDVGALDTLRADAGGARVAVHSASGIVTASSGGTTARYALPDSLKIRRVLVLGDADWESKFVLAALEENGWKVDVQTPLAPGVSISQGAITPIDTARYAAVVALDNAASAYASQIVRYVNNGGGLVIGADAAAIDGLASLRAGSSGRVDAAASIAAEPGSVTLESLPIVPVASMKSDAIALDKRNGSTIMAARRVGAGRVLQVGIRETWRWRMSGGETSVTDHRNWWTSTVATVAYAPASPQTNTSNVDNAPLARLIGALGPATPLASVPKQTKGPLVPLWLLFAILSVALLGEWASRRTRGER